MALLSYLGKTGERMLGFQRTISAVSAAVMLATGVLAMSSSAWANDTTFHDMGFKAAATTPMKETDIDPRVVKTASANGCTARVIEFKARNSSGGGLAPYHRSTISCGMISGGTEARAHLDCIAAPDRYTSWARSGETWESGSCKKSEGVSVQVR